MTQVKIVAIGGGAGLPLLLSGLRKYDTDLTAIVSVTDTGRSSGILRNELKILSPGDIRNCLLALADIDEDFKQLVSYRFDDSFLSGISFGNLLIAALAKIYGSFEKGIEVLGSILKVKGRVFPGTVDITELCAELASGEVIEGENTIRKAGKQPIKRVFLKQENARAHPEAVKKILEADLIVIGPGSLYTSVITNLLVKEIREAIIQSKAKKVFVCNVMTQPGQTDDYKVSDHIKVLEGYLGDILDYVVINTDNPPSDILKSYEEIDARLVKFDKENLKNIKPKIIEAPIAYIKPRGKLFDKIDLLKHDPQKLTPILLELTKGDS